MKNIYFYDTKIGKIAIAEENNKIIRLSFNTQIQDHDYVIKETDILRKAAKELYEYLDGKRTTFNIPLNPIGTDFMISVWNELLKIPYGKTVSYKNIAENIGNKNACRAVGMANNKNPIGIFIPCHRVIGTSGKLVGYVGGLDIKIKLLDIEKQAK